MGLAFRDLDEATRAFMCEEIQMDAENGSIYLSNYLNEPGKEAWPQALLYAARSGSDDSLAAVIRDHRFLRAKSERRTKHGTTLVSVPVTAHHTMAESEFNRYYCRGLCRRAIDEGIPTLEVYRAKEVNEPRPDSVRKIGQQVDPQAILNDLRATNGVEPALGLPPGPNSGLTLRFPG